MNFGFASFAAKSGLTFAVERGDHILANTVIHTGLGGTLIGLQFAFATVETALAVAFVTRTVVVDTGGSVSTGIGRTVVYVFLTVPAFCGLNFAMISFLFLNRFEY